MTEIKIKAVLKTCSTACPDLPVKTYEKLAARGEHKILTLLMNRTQIGNFHDRLKTERSGPPHFYSYFGFIQRELSKYWPLVDKLLPQGITVLSPTYLTMEATQYLTTTMVEKYSQKGYFHEILASPERLAMQITDSRSKAALNGIEQKDISRLLKEAWTGSAEKAAAYEQVQEIIEEYRSACLEQRLLDYPLAVELYNDYLFSNPIYQQHLTEEFRHLIVDNLEETVPVAQDLIVFLLNRLESALLIYSEDGGHSIFFGSDPFSARTLIEQCEVEIHEACPTCSKAVYQWAQTLGQAVKNRPAQPKPCPILGEPIFTELRSEMINEVGRRVLALLHRDVPAGDIALIAPFVDKVLEFSLEQLLSAEGYKLENITRSHRLLDRPFALALVTLAELAHPQWEFKPGYGELLETMHLVLNTDPVRAGLLAEFITSSKKHSLPVLDLEIQNRLGQAVSKKYNLLANWLEHYRSQPVLTLEAFMQRVFGEILSPLAPGTEQIISCRQLINSAIKFNPVIESLPEQFPGPAGKYFVDMIKRGTVAAETMEKFEPGSKTVILATPYAYLLTVPSSSYQFWLDISGESWFNGDAREISNPHVLSRRWSPGAGWTGELDQVTRLEKAARTLRGLAHRCRDGLITAGSTYSSFGWEQFGPLPDIIEQITDRGDYHA